jgi:hypothetical protein
LGCSQWAGTLSASFSIDITATAVEHIAQIGHPPQVGRVNHRVPGDAFGFLAQERFDRTDPIDQCRIRTNLRTYIRRSQHRRQSHTSPRSSVYRMRRNYE